MDRQRQLHAGRLKEGRNRIATLRESGETAHSPGFRAWQERVEQSLEFLFGEDHGYTARFSSLSFWIARMSPMEGGVVWDIDDQERFERDLQLADRILRDALEELEFLPPRRGSASPVTGSAPSVVVNVTNVLSQTTEIQLAQILSGLDDLHLSTSDRERVEKYAQEFEAEANDEQRWPVLAGSLDSLKRMEKHVYERVAIPLLLELLRKQAGL